MFSQLSKLNLLLLSEKLRLLFNRLFSIEVSTFLTWKKNYPGQKCENLLGPIYQAESMLFQIIIGLFLNYASLYQLKFWSIFKNSKCFA